MLADKSATAILWFFLVSSMEKLLLTVYKTFKIRTVKSAAFQKVVRIKRFLVWILYLKKSSCLIFWQIPGHRRDWPDDRSEPFPRAAFPTGEDKHQPCQTETETELCVLCHSHFGSCPSASH